MVTRWTWLVLCVLFFSACGGGYEGRLATIRAQHPQWDEGTLSKVAAKNVQPGMTREMVKAAMGSPESVTKQGDEEEWGYAYEDNSRWDRAQVFVYFVSFKGDSVVRTRGDTSRLQSIY